VHSLCCAHLGKRVLCTVLRALGLVHDNDLKVCGTKLYICIYACLCLRPRSLCDYEVGESG
jgi:hypothetical protein